MKQAATNMKIPGFYRSIIEVQSGFHVFPDQGRRLPAVLEHIIKPESLERMTEEISRLSSVQLDERLGLMRRCFEGVRGLDDFLLRVFDQHFGDTSPLNSCSQSVKIVAAASLVQVFPYEGLACFNPTIVTYLGRRTDAGADGQEPVVVAQRSYGEYHRSSISFRTGVLDGEGLLHLDEPEKTPGGYTVTELPAVNGSCFSFPEDADLNHCVLYAPFMTDISETWEDIRFTRFSGEGEFSGAYLGTFTSFNFIERRLLACMLVTRDFRSFEYQVLKGSGAEDKDLACFPRKINNRYAMLSRNNGRDLFFMTSEDMVFWNKKKLIARCRPGSFDAHKIGICAPPIETSDGWLVIYHGVADPGQIYSLGAMLLDFDDPTIVTARLPYTIHHPFADEKYGMLTTINYTCGAIVHEATGTLVIPYACNDTCWKVGRIRLDELLARLKEDGAL